MVLTKDELLNALSQEIRILLHLADKVDPAKLDYRPTAKQRSTLELLQYLTILGPIHFRAVFRNRFDMDEWSNALRSGVAAAKLLTLAEARDAIGKQIILFAELLRPASEADLRAEIEMFGHKASRGSFLVSLVLCHLTAYRMQLFLYLKGSGREELSTLNLWAGMDPPANPG